MQKYVLNINDISLAHLEILVRLLVETPALNEQ